MNISSFKRKILIIVSSLVSLTAICQENCSDFRLDTPGQAFEKIPLYNQEKIDGEDLNICYAISAAQLIDADRFSKGDTLKELTSPLSIHANNLQNSEPKTTAESYFKMGSSVGLALKNINHKKVCIQEYLENFMSIYDNYPNSSSETQLSNIAIFKSLIKDIEMFKNAKDGLNENVRNIEFIGDEIYCSQFSGKFNSNILDIQQALLAAINKNEVPEQILSFFDKICEKNNFEISLKDINTYTGWINPDGTRASKDSLFKINKINKVFELWKDPSKRFPIAVSYNPDMLIKTTNPGGMPRHASVIIGRRKTANSCEVLLRNSYGAKCGNSELQSRFKYPCENGGHWVPLGTLMENTSFLTWISPS